MKKYLLIVFLFIAAEATAQTACTQNLLRARTTFDEGNIQLLPDLLLDCINNKKNGFTDEERTEAYRLLILAYIYQDEPEKADETMLALLKDNPLFQINEAVDPAELINLYNTFRTHPIFHWGVKIGPNTTLINTREVYGANNSLNSSGSYSLAAGFQGGISFEIPFLKKFYLNPEIQFIYRVFDYENTNLYAADGFSGSPGSQPANILVKESQALFKVPIMLQYKFMDKPYNPYVALGPSLSYLLSDSFSGDTDTFGEDFSGVSEDLMDARNPLGYGIEAGVGVKFRTGKSYFTIDLRYNYEISSYVDKSASLNQSLLFNYAYDENEYTASTVSLQLGYLFEQYKPKKLTH